MGSNAVVAVALAVTAAATVTAMVIVFRWKPVTSVIAWGLAMFFTPVWMGVQAGVFVTALTAVTVVAIVGAPSGRLRATSVDVIVGALFSLLIVLSILRAADGAHVQEVLLMWAIPYLWGRVVLTRADESRVAGVVAAMAAVAAILAVVEFATGVNVFHMTPGATSSSWGSEQIRAGLPRAEAAFGHSIALGGTLAMSVPFALVAAWPAWVRVAALTIIGTAVGFSFSRLGLVTFALATLLSVIFLRRRIPRAVRWTVVGLLTLGSVVALPLLLAVFGEAGSEAEGSAEYRSDLLPLLDSAALLGTSASREVLATGQTYFGGFRSIDNALLLAALRFGLVPLALLILVLVIAVIAVARGHANVGLIALTSQIPAFGTVALITQYASFVWFAAGLAVASYTLEQGRADSDVSYTEQAVLRA